jgi:predicted lactoylglutathione lyase
MTISPLLISLPIADRPRAHRFYRDALGLEPVGEPAEDGVPEPLVFELNQHTSLMLVPTGGFGWVIGDREVAGSGTSECVLGLPAATDADVDAIVDRARGAGAVVTTGPGPQPWGYAATFTDPDGHLWMVTSAPLPK